MARFRTTGERYDVAASAHVYTAEATLREGHTVTREHSHSNRFGPVPGSHWVEYRCSCGARAVGGRASGPHGTDLDRLRHFESAAEREAFEAEESERLARVLRDLGRA